MRTIIAALSAALLTGCASVEGQRLAVSAADIAALCSPYSEDSRLFAFCVARETADRRLQRTEVVK